MENSTQQNKKYYNEITIAKGIGILLVVQVIYLKFCSCNQDGFLCFIVFFHPPHLFRFSVP